MEVFKKFAGDDDPDDAVYQAWFGMADQNRDRAIDGREAVAFLRRSRLSDQVLGKIEAHRRNANDQEQAAASSSSTGGLDTSSPKPAVCAVQAENGIESVEFRCSYAHADAETGRRVAHRAKGDGRGTGRLEREAIHGGGTNGGMQVWELSSKGAPTLDFKSFTRALMLVSAAQRNGGELNEVEARSVLAGMRKMPLPFMEGVKGSPPHPTAAKPAAPGAAAGAAGGQGVGGAFAGLSPQLHARAPVGPAQPPMPRPAMPGAAAPAAGGVPLHAAAGGLPLLQPAQRARYEALFRQHDQGGSGQVSNMAAATAWGHWGLSKNVLFNVYNLVAGEASSLTRQQFVSGCYLLDLSKANRPLPPPPLPAVFPPEAASPAAAASALQPGMPSSQPPSYQPQVTGGSAAPYNPQVTGGSAGGYQPQVTGGAAYTSQVTGGSGYQQQHTGGSAAVTATAAAAGAAAGGAFAASVGGSTTYASQPSGGGYRSAAAAGAVPPLDEGMVAQLDRSDQTRLRQEHENLQKLDKGLGEMKNQLTDARSKADYFKKELQTQTLAKSRLQTQTLQVEEELQRAQESAEEAEKRCKAVEEEMSALLARGGGLQAQLASVMQMKQSWEQRVAERQAELVSMNAANPNDLERAQVALQELQRQDEELEGKLQQLKLQRLSQQRKQEMAQEKLRQLQNSKVAMEGEVAHTSQQIHFLTSQLEAEEKEGKLVETLGSNLSAASKLLTTLMQHAKRLNTGVPPDAVTSVQAAAKLATESASDGAHSFGWTPDAIATAADWTDFDGEQFVIVNTLPSLDIDIARPAAGKGVPFFPTPDADAVAKATALGFPPRSEFPPAANAAVAAAPALEDAFASMAAGSGGADADDAPAALAADAGLSHDPFGSVEVGASGSVSATPTAAAVATAATPPAAAPEPAPAAPAADPFAPDSSWSAAGEEQYESVLTDDPFAPPPLAPSEPAAANGGITKSDSLPVDPFAPPPEPAPTSAASAAPADPFAAPPAPAEGGLSKSGSLQNDPFAPPAPAAPTPPAAPAAPTPPAVPTGDSQPASDPADPAAASPAADSGAAKPPDAFAAAAAAPFRGPAAAGAATDLFRGAGSADNPFGGSAAVDNPFDGNGGAAGGAEKDTSGEFGSSFWSKSS